jgi:tetratricopeptide (TPR) repeat protein
MSRKLRNTFIVLGGILVLAVIISLPPVWIHIGWRLDNAILVVSRWINPPENVIFVPSGGSTVTPAVPTETPFPTSTPEIQPTPTITPTSLPPFVQLTGVKFVHQHEKWNYCAPSNLSMVLSYWESPPPSRDTIAHVVKPWDEDKNVMPYELQDYVNNYTDNKLQALVRVGGNLQILKNLLANGFVVLVEKGVTTFRDTTTGKLAWMGHYNTVLGYDDSTQQVIVDDSFIGQVDNPGLGINLRIPYSEFIDQWRDFDYIFLVVYPPEKQNDVLNAIGILADETSAFQEAARVAEEETKTQSGLELYMAWFNLGTSRYKLQDYQGAADAYDQAFLIYPTIPDEQRPWRMLWYQTGPYFAYYYTVRYNELVTLATQTIDSTPKPYLEESFYWRAMAELELGEQSKAVEDLNTAYKYHPGFPPVVDLMQQLGIPTPTP